MLLSVKLFAIVLLPFVAAATFKDKPIGLNENCYGCICEATTNCTVNTPCKRPYPGGFFCGPFLISQAYWKDAGRPVLHNDNPERRGAFENCVLDLQCAAETVQGYMTKFGKDCNNDGKIDCDDYMRIHGLGGFSCADSRFELTKLYKSFDRCFRVVSAASVPTTTKPIQLARDTTKLIQLARAQNTVFEVTPPTAPTENDEVSTEEVVAVVEHIFLV